MQLERVLAVLEHVARADRLGGSLPGRRAGTNPHARLDGDRRAEPEAARLGAEHDVRLLRSHPRPRARSTVSRSASGSASSGVMSLKPTPGRREVVHLPDLGLQVDGHCTPSLAGRARRAATRARCASSASCCRSRSACARRSALRPRSAGATSCSSSAASRPVAVRNVRRLRGADAVARQLRARRGDVGVRLGIALRARRCRAARADRTPRAPSRAPASTPARSQSSSRVIVSSSAPSAVGRWRLRSFAPGASSSSRITRSGRNSSRCSRRIVCSRSRSASLKSR